MTAKQIRRNAPAGAEYYSIVGGEVCYYSTSVAGVHVYTDENWLLVEWVSKDILLDDDFHKIRRSTWREWVVAIVFSLAFVTVLGVAYG